MEHFMGNRMQKKSEHNTYICKINKLRDVQKVQTPHNKSDPTNQKHRPNEN